MNLQENQPAWIRNTVSCQKKADKMGETTLSSSKLKKGKKIIESQSYQWKEGKEIVMRV